jgi:hypothetical protein
MNSLNKFNEVLKEVKEVNKNVAHYICVEIAKIIIAEAKEFAKKIMTNTYRNLKALAYQISLDSLIQIINNGTDDKLAWECFNLKKHGLKFQASKIDFKPLFNRTYNK